MAEVPKYRRILDDLRTEIAEGDLVPGAKLPSEKELASKYGVAIETVRRALKALVQEGAIVQIHGRGTFVRDWTPILRNIGKRMGRDVWGTGKSVWDAETKGRDSSTETKAVYQGEAPASVGRLLGETDVWVRQRRHFVDGRPVMLSVSYYPTSIVAGSPITELDTGEGGAPARLADLGYAPDHHSTRFRARMPSSDEIDRLQIPAGTPVAVFLRTSFNESDRPIEVTEMVASGDAFIFQFDFTS